MSVKNPKQLTCRALTKNEEELVQNALLRARKIRPYYGRALAALTPYAVDGLGTVGVGEGWQLYIDTKWFAALPKEQQGGVIACHEIEHLLRDHAGRRKNRQPKPWNCAADAEINDDAEEGMLPSGGVTPKTLGQKEGLMAEEYYKNLPVIKVGVCGGGSGTGDPHDWEPKGEEMSPEEAEILRKQVAQDIVGAVRAGEAVPEHARIWAEARVTTRPEDWKRILQRYIVQKSREIERGREDYSWSKMSRRTRPGSPLRPGTISRPANIGVLVDTSGSMLGNGDCVLSTVEGICRVGGRRVNVVQCDTEVRAKGKKVWSGGGGTDLAAGLEALKGSDLIVVITDGECPPLISKKTLIAAVTTEVPTDWADMTVRLK